ncbi:MAG: 2-oxoacid:acceptor oxidoreductase family protein, partial [Dehalococcoidia bacterium]|nr:2-oxoacid:acceptor oxidoreductase family protein [Dehalococcoidia bacterium]
FNWPIASVNATKIARETIKLPITNTAMIGAFLKVSDAVKVNSVVEELKERFGARAEANIEAMKRAYNQIVIKE